MKTSILALTIAILSVAIATNDSMAQNTTCYTSGGYTTCYNNQTGMTYQHFDADAQSRQMQRQADQWMQQNTIEVITEQQRQIDLLNQSRCRNGWTRNGAPC